MSQRASLMAAVLILGFAATPASAAGSDERSFLHAEGILREGKTQEARDAFRRVVEGYPESSLADDSLYRLATMEFAPGDIHDLTRADAAGAAVAFPLLEKIRGNYPDSDRMADARYLQGLAHMVPGSSLYDLDKAFAAFREVVDVHPDSAVAPQALRATATVELRAGRPGRALLYLERLWMLHPGNPTTRRAHLDAADAYLRLGLVREAMVRLEPLQRLGVGPEAEAALDLMTLLTTLDVLKPEPLRAPVAEAFRSPDGAARSVVSMVHDASGVLHLLADSGRKLLSLGPTGAIESETTLRDGRFLFKDVTGDVAWASADTLHLSSGSVSPTSDAGAAPKPLRDIAQVAAAPDGSFYILEGKGTEVHHVAADGAPLGIVVRPTKGVALALDRQGWIYVLDARARKVLRIGPDGEDQGSLYLTQGEDRVSLPSSLAVDDAFHTYVLDEKTGEVWIFGATGMLLTRLRPDPDNPDPVRDPSGMTVSPSGSVVLYDAKARAVRSFR